MQIKDNSHNTTQLNHGRKKIMNKARNISLIALFAVLAMFVLFQLPSTSAAIALVKPAVGNYSGTIIVNVTLAVADCLGCLNASVYYNASGGTTNTYLTKITNTTYNQTQFYNGAVSVAALSDLKTYNFSVRLDNGTYQVWTVGTAKITIDNTAPTGTAVFDLDTVQMNAVQKFTWTSSDATSGVKTVSVSSVSPNTDKCPTQTSSATSGTLEYVGSTETGCAGTYTSTVTITDYAGNTYSPSDTFKVYTTGKSNNAVGSGVGVSSGAIGFGDIEAYLNNKVVIVTIIVIVIYFAATRKK